MERKKRKNLQNKILTEVILIADFLPAKERVYVCGMRACTGGGGGVGGEGVDGGATRAHTS